MRDYKPKEGFAAFTHACIKHMRYIDFLPVSTMSRCEREIRHDVILKETLASFDLRGVHSEVRISVRRSARMLDFGVIPNHVSLSIVSSIGELSV